MLIVSLCCNVINQLKISKTTSLNVKHEFFSCIMVILKTAGWGMRYIALFFALKCGRSVDMVYAAPEKQHRHEFFSNREYSQLLYRKHLLFFYHNMAL